MLSAASIMTREKFPLLATLDDSSLRNFQQHATCLHIEKGEQLLAEGRENNHLYLVSSGKMVVRKQHQGRELPIGLVGGGDVCGERSLLQDQPTSAAIYGIAATKVYKISGKVVLQQYENNAHFRRAINLVIERRHTNSALALNNLFSVLAMEVRQSMYHAGEMAYFDRGDILIRQYDRDIRRSYLLLAGKVKSTIVVPDDSNQSITVSHHSMGDQVGEIMLLSDPVRIATVTAATPVTALCISNKILHTFRMGNLDFAMALYDNTRSAMMKQMNILIPKIGEKKARAATLDRMIPLDLYRNPEKQMEQPFAS